MAQQNFITNLYLHPALLQARRYACKARRAETASAPLDSFLFYTIFSQ